MSIWRTRPAAQRQRMQRRNASARWHVCTMYSRFQQSSRCSSWHSTPLREGGKIMHAVTLAACASSEGLSANGASLSNCNCRRAESLIQCFVYAGMKLVWCKQLHHPLIHIWQIGRFPLRTLGAEVPETYFTALRTSDKPHTSPSDSSFAPSHRSAWLVPLVDIGTSRNDPVLGTLIPHLPEVAEAQATPGPDFDAWSWQQLRSSKMTWVPKATRSLMR